MKLSYNLDEAAAATGLSKAHLKKEMREGRLKSVTTKMNDQDVPVGRRLILTDDLKAYLDGLARA